MEGCSINSFTAAIFGVEIYQALIAICDFNFIAHRVGNVEHQRDIDRLGDDLRLALAGDVGFERQIASLFIIFLMRFDAAGRAVVLRRACCNRYHGQNHNNSQQKR